jgi:colanic acid/amylovoran biosynthesis protein
MMKIVLSTVTGCRNRGVEALLDTIVDQLHASCSDVQITVLTDDCAFDSTRRFAERVTLLPDVLVPSRRAWVRNNQIIGKLARKRWRGPAAANLEAINSADLVIATGGDCFTSDYGGADRWLFALELAQERGIPVYFLGQSIGIFKTDAEAQAWSRVALRGMTSVRESHSYKYVTEELKIPADRVALTADPAFLLQMIDEPGRTVIRQRHGITGERPVVGLGVSQGVSSFAGADQAEHLQVWLSVIQMILDEWGANVLIVPHVQVAHPDNDDRLLATRILQAMNYDPRVHLAGGTYSAREFKTLLGGCDMVIGQRMHACLAGLSSGVATVAIGYSLKAEGIMNDLFGHDAVTDGLLIPQPRFMEGGQLDALRDVWRRRAEHGQILQQRLPQIRQRALLNFKLVGQIVERSPVVAGV